MKAKNPVNNQILEEASCWFVTFRSQDLSEGTRQNFQDWLKRSPEHIRAYLEIASVYAYIPPPEHGRTPPELIERAKASPEVNVVQLSALAPASLSVLEEREGARGAGRTRVLGRAASGAWSIAAMLLMLIGVATWFYVQRNVYSTDIGEQRSITMTDGSIIELNARSRVHISVDDNQRVVELLEGQALFRVAKDRNRPFTVHAGPTSVRAVGTQFDVNRKSTGTIVTVLEGRVAILPSTALAELPTPVLPPPSISDEKAGDGPRTYKSTDSGNVLDTGTVLLAAGEQLTVTRTHAEKTERPNIAAATAWTQHQLVFDGTPLREVIEEFSRYTSRPLIVDTPELAELRISGQYTSANPDSLLRFLSLQQGVVVTEVNGETHIRRE